MTAQGRLAKALHAVGYTMMQVLIRDDVKEPTAAQHHAAASILAADPTLAQDTEDGRALRELVKALPSWWGGPDVSRTHQGWRFQVWTSRGAGVVITRHGETIAEGADNCRAALLAQPMLGMAR